MQGLLKFKTKKTDRYDRETKDGRVRVLTADLFAGIGGFRLGLESAFDLPRTDRVFKTVWANDWDKSARNAYRANFGALSITGGDISKVPSDNIPTFDMLTAGFPCQSFSQAGKKLGFEDTRGTLFYEIARIVRDRKPTAFLLENVDNLVRHDKGKTFKIVTTVLEKHLGYSVRHKVINAIDFGLPQHRDRVFIAGFRDHGASKKFSFPVGSNTSARLRDILEDDIKPKYFVSQTYHEWMKAHRKRHEEKGHGFGYVVRDLDSHCKALVCGGMGRERNLVATPEKLPRRMVKMTAGRDNPLRLTDEGLRYLTPREMARLMGFPDSFTIPVADTHAYRLFPNSVAVPVVRAIAEKIYLALTDS